MRFQGGDDAIKISWHAFEKRYTQKKKKMLPLGANSSLIG